MHTYIFTQKNYLYSTNLSFIYSKLSLKLSFKSQLPNTLGKTFGATFVINSLKSGDPHLESEFLFSDANECCYKF